MKLHKLIHRHRLFNTTEPCISSASTWAYVSPFLGIHFALLILIGSNANAQGRLEAGEAPTVRFSTADELLVRWDSLEDSSDQHFIELDADEWLTSVVHFEKLAKAQSDDSTLFQLQYVHGSLLFYLSSYYRAIPFLKATLEQRQALTEGQLKWTLVNLEESYRRTANLKEAIPLRKERIELGYDNDFFEIYEEAGLYNEAIDEFTQHNAFPKSPLDRLGYHARIGRLHNQNNQLDSAIYHYEKAFAFGFETLDKEDYPGKRPLYDFRKRFWTYEMQGEIGAIYVKQGRYQDAIPFLKKIIAVGKEINESALVVPKRLALAECYLKLNDISLARKHLDTVRQLTSEMDWFLHKVKYQEVLGEYYFGTGAFDSAAIAFKEYTKLKDSIQSIQNENKLIATTAFLDNERQGKLLAEQRLELVAFENERIQKSNQIIILIVVFIGALGLAFFLFLDTRRKQKAKEKALFDKGVIEEQSAKIQELDQVKTRFFSNISHEFRTPLTLIQGPIDSILIGKAKGQKAVEQNLNVASRNVRVLKTLIDEILEFNKMDSGQLNVEVKPVLLLDYFQELSASFHLLAKENGVSWHMNLDFDQSLWLDLPIAKIESVINNLVSNAIKHTPHGNEVSMSVSVRGGTLEIAVADQGVGISEEELDKVFERFYQAAEGKMLPHSSGIGLAYVKEITEMLGGTISVQSEQGTGSTFTFTLPDITISHARVISEEDDVEVDASPKYSHPNNKILVVEDNEELAAYIAQILGSEFEIEKAENGKVALNRLEGFDPDLIISDIMMPVMDGLELLAHIKSHPKWMYKSVVMLTAKSSHETRIEALSFGLDDYLTKPFSPLELEIRVKNILNNQYERSQHLTVGAGQAELSDPVIEGLISEIEDNLSNKHFGVLNLSERVALSDRQLTRIVKKSIGMTPAGLIRNVRLQKAKDYLETKKYRSVTEVSYAVGFEKPSHFTKIYFDRYGKKPSWYFS
ncbi:MAG: ATP-binding protein [Cyclobacteriaceae bacterium]